MVPRWQQGLRSYAMGFDSTWMPAEVWDKIRLGVVKEVAGNHNGLFPISRDAESCKNQGVPIRKWEEPVVNGVESPVAQQRSQKSPPASQLQAKPKRKTHPSLHLPRTRM
jgi:hypothetical protein